ncbi:MAG: Unknown protein [uncultured Campylobacterales bacterium]|uniref:Uncharacterized protein n=1 Tax=uncultured Campylobacterales bacterium TaxID=352960 RepID=A0A6S6SIF1_9BACT|nr:MAG: Unknown protein [uncultured Campylobacterales bacterium]
MNKEFFSKKSKSFLKNDMCICLKSLSDKIILDAPSQLIFFNELVECIRTLKVPFEYEKELSSSNNLNNKDFIDKELIKFVKPYKTVKEGSKEYHIFDVLCHVFIHYSQGGVYQAYKHREVEEWYPKIIIKKFIKINDSKDSLKDETIIYRGTCREEYDSKEFGQSWTIDKNIESRFPINSCKDDKIIIKTRIKKIGIFYFDEDDFEKEVIINQKELIIESIKIDSINLNLDS